MVKPYKEIAEQKLSSERIRANREWATAEAHKLITGAIMRELIIKESEWAHNNGVSQLLQPGASKKKCCIGFDMLDRGFSEADIAGCYTPSDFLHSDRCPRSARQVKADLLSWLIDVRVNSRDCGNLMEVNDFYDSDQLTVDLHKEFLAGNLSKVDFTKKKITEIYAKHGVKVTFVP